MHAFPDIIDAPIGPHNAHLIRRDNLIGDLPWHHYFREAQLGIARTTSLARAIANALEAASWRRPLSAFDILSITLAHDARAKLTSFAERKLFDFTDASALTINMKTGSMHIAEPLTIQALDALRLFQE